MRQFRFQEVKSLQQAIQCYGAGEIHQAEQLCHTVLRHDPTDAVAANLQQLIQLQINHDNEQSTLPINIKQYATWYELAELLFADEQYQVAYRLLKQMAEPLGATADYRHKIAVCQYHAGLIENAIENLQQAINIDSGHIASYQSLVELLRNEARHQHANTIAGTLAEKIRQGSIDVTPEQMLFACNQMAYALWTERQFDECEQVVERALAMDRHDSVANVIKARLCMLHDEWFEARRHFWLAYVGDKTNVEAFAGLIEINEPPPRYLIQGLLDNKSVLATKRSMVYYLLAQLDELEQDYDQAFDHYQQAKRLTRQFSNGNDFFNQVNINTVKQVITADAIADLTVTGHSSSQPIFIVGMPHSGQQLVENILGRHSHIDKASERDCLREVANIETNTVGTHKSLYPYAFTDLTQKNIDEITSYYLEQINCRTQGIARHVVDSSIDNSLLLGLIAILFPHAKIIYCKRDAVDVTLACYLDSKLALANDLSAVAALYQSHEQLMQHWQQQLLLNFIGVSYEQLVAEPESTSLELLQQLGLSWQQQCLISAGVDDIDDQQALQRAGYEEVGRWQHFSQHIAPLLALKSQ